MKSLIIGISRPGDPDNALLSPDTKYVARCGSNPEVTFSIDCRQKEFFDNVKGLRYTDGDPSAATASISFFEKLIAKVFNDLKYLVINDADNDPLHIRLVASAMELAQLPFEFVPLSWNSMQVISTALLTNPGKIITLTREVLQASEARYVWPKQPRILFIWAEPSNSVPHQDHKNALLNALKPLVKPKKDIPEPEPDMDPFFKELPNASLKLIKEEISLANGQKKPYSHIHILAHGGHVTDFSGVNFRLLLCDDDPESKLVIKADGDDLQKAIISDKNENMPIIVTLSSCDSANTGNVMEPSGSLVYQLHRAGIPCVFASQFPLTQDGSIDLVKSLYSDLVNACDPREALYNARMVLKNNNSHDWASLVAYARFPEDINVQLQAIRLRMLFASMKTTVAWADHVLKYKDEIIGFKKEAIFAEIESRQEESIKDLSKFLNSKKESILETEALRSEHLGLLGSAYKRKAEFFYRLIEFNPEKKLDYINKSQKALNLAKEFYDCGYEADITNHWTAMQFISLKAAMGESIETDNELLIAIDIIARKKESKAKKLIAEIEMKEINEEMKKMKENTEMEILWAWGTLAELYLLKPLTVPRGVYKSELTTSHKKACEYISLIKANGNEEIIDSTARQLDRYISWWPEMYPHTFPNELKVMAEGLVNILLAKVEEPV